jgi:hypothetical protein
MPFLTTAYPRAPVELIPKKKTHLASWHITPQLGLKMFMECSAKTGENVDAAYIQLARMVKHRLIDSNPDYQAGACCPTQASRSLYYWTHREHLSCCSKQNRPPGRVASSSTAPQGQRIRPRARRAGAARYRPTIYSQLHTCRFCWVSSYRCTEANAPVIKFRF